MRPQGRAEQRTVSVEAGLGIVRAQSPIKVHEAAKEKVRYAALMAGLKQAELVEGRRPIPSGPIPSV